MSAIIGLLAGANDTNIIRRVWRVVTGIRSFIAWLEQRGVDTAHVKALINKDGDVSMDDVRQVLTNFKANLDDLEAEIEAKRQSEGDADDDGDGDDDESGDGQQ